LATVQINTVIRHLCQAAYVPYGAIAADRELLDAFIDHQDERAFEALVRRHGAMVLNVCRRVASHHHDAEDAFQATFLVLARRAASVRPRDMVGNWLHGVAYRTALKARALRARRQQRERQVPRLPDVATHPRDRWDDLRPILDEELQRLPEVCRLPIVLCDLEGRTIKDATQQLGWPQGTLAGRLARGRKILARRLARRGVALSGGLLAALVSEHALSAGVSTALLSRIVKVAATIATGQAAASGIIPSQVAVLMEGVMKSMSVSKFQTVASIIALAAFGIFGTSLLAQKLEPPTPHKAGHASSPIAPPNAQEVPPSVTSMAKPTKAAGAAQPPGTRPRVVYAVADLVVPIQGLDGNDPSITKEGWLIQKIKRTVAPQTWEDQGGKGSIQYLPLGHALVVRNSPSVHASINRLLETMRRAQDIQVSVELRVLTVRKACVPKLQELFADLKRDRELILNDAETFALLEKAQSDRANRLLQAPKLTLFPGQRVGVRADQLEVKLTALVAANLHHVDIDLKARMGNLQWADSTRLTSGTTLVLVTASSDHELHLLLATPRVVIDFDEPERQTGSSHTSAGTAAPLAAAAERQQLHEALAAYEKACAVGDLEIARHRARQALDIDPACFQRVQRSTSQPNDRPRATEPASRK
jgi:RNA polymerase sigma factor (sigma-70 family)